MNTLDTKCPSESILRDFGLGKLDAASAETVSQHIETCPDCQRRVASISGDSFVGRLRQADNPAPRRERTYVPGESLANAANSTDGIREDGLPRPSRKSSDAKLGGLRSPSSVSALPELANHPDYELIKQLGEGGMGTVYLAKNCMMDRLEVLKVISKSLLDRPGALERFQQEIRSAAKLAHPNIVAAYSVLRPGDLLVFAMEYVKGQDLSHVVKQRGPLPVANAAFYIHQVANGLQHAHEKGMVHRDIKPNNLMLAIEGKKHVVKILDFGLAKASSEKGAESGLTKSGQMLGTPDYVAPEQTLNAHKADIRADIYSLGCTLYYLLSGGPPFQEQSLFEILQAHHTRDPRPLNLVRPEVPVELAAVVATMMAKDPGHRYQTPGEVAKALVPFFKPGQSMAVPAPAGTPLAAETAHELSSTISPPAITPPPIAIAQHVTQAGQLALSPTVIISRKPSNAGRRRRPPWLAIAGGVGFVALLLGVIVVIRDRSGKEVARLEVPDAGSVEIKPVDNQRIAAPVMTEVPGTEKPPTPEGIGAAASGRSAPSAAPAAASGPTNDATATAEPSVPDALAKLKADGAFGFPQSRAQLLCDTGKLRLSLWNNREYLYVQAIVWNYPDDRDGVNALADYSHLTLITAPNLSITPDLDRMYQASNSQGFGYAIMKGPAVTTGVSKDSRGHSSIRYVDVGDGQRARIDSFIIPLTEIKKQPQDQLGVAFRLAIAQPPVQLASKAGGGPHPVTLGDDSNSFDPSGAGFDLPQPIKPLPAEVGNPAPFARFLFNGNCRDEIRDGTKSEVLNASYQDNALYVNGKYFSNSGDEVTVHLITEPMDIRRFTAALRFKAAEFDSMHNTFLGTYSWRWFLLSRSQAGNVCVNLNQGEYFHEFAGAGIKVDEWASVACGIDLNAAKCVLYLNGKKVGEVELPKDFKFKDGGEQRPTWVFGDYSRGAIYHGLVDELIIYDKLLSPDEFAKIPLQTDVTSAANSRHPREDAPRPKVAFNPDDPAFREWLSHVRKLPALRQVSAVKEKLQELNPGFDGALTPKMEGEVITELNFISDNVDNIAPLAALQGLKRLRCSGSARRKGVHWTKGILADLSPLAGLKLVDLNCFCTKVADLSPLRGMRLTSLNICQTLVADLSPLKGMPLNELNCCVTNVADLKPLQGMPLTNLMCGSTKIESLVHLKGMRLTSLQIHVSKVTDLSPLKGMRLTHLNLQSTPVADLTPLKGMPISDLDCWNSKVENLLPLKGMPLKSLQVSNTPVSNLAPLKGSPLTYLWCSNTKVADLSPLKGMSLTSLCIDKSRVKDLSPLSGMPLDFLMCDFEPARDTEVLRSIRTLNRINNKPAAEFWKEFENKQ